MPDANPITLVVAEILNRHDPGQFEPFEIVLSRLPAYDSVARALYGNPAVAPHRGGTR